MDESTQQVGKETEKQCSSRLHNILVQYYADTLKHGVEVENGEIRVQSRSNKG